MLSDVPPQLQAKGINKAQYVKIREWLHAIDMHNHFGADFISNKEMGKTYSDAMIKLAKSTTMDTQSGTDTDDYAYGNRLLDDIDVSCKLLFKQYEMLLVTLHSTDVFPYVISVQHYLHRNRKSQGYITFVTLPGSYYAMGFVPTTESNVRHSFCDDDVPLYHFTFPFTMF